MAADEADEHLVPVAASPLSPLASPRALAASSNTSPSSPPDTRDSEGLKAAPVRTDDYDDDEDPLDAADALLAQQDDHHPRLTRSRASSFSVDFSGRLLQLTASTERGADGGSAAERGQRAGSVKEHVSLAGGCALVVGIVIGSGIFSSPGVVAKETGSVGTALLVWLAAGMLSWAGGSSFAELGSALPMNGGHQVYLSAAFGPLASFAYSFTAVTALKPGGQAIISIISAEYLCRIFWHTAFEPDPRAAARGIPTVAIKLVAIACLCTISGVHMWSTRAGTRAQLVVTVFKVLALVLVFIGGLVYLALGSHPASDFTFAGSSDKPAGYALALFSALWTFDGWDAANFIGRDVVPGSLPLMINSSMGMIVTLFLLANVSYFLVLPFDIATATTTIGLDFGRALAGPVGGLLFAIIVSISALGALNGTLYTSSRLVVAASEQGFLPRTFATFNSRQKTPINGILLSTALSTIFICFGDFGTLTLFYGVCAWTWNLAVVIGLLVLRVTEPTLKRPYRTYLATPILFASTALFLIVLSLFSKPWQSLAAFAFCVAGTVPYYLHVRPNERRKAAEGLEMT